MAGEKSGLGDWDKEAFSREKTRKIASMGGRAPHDLRGEPAGAERHPFSEEVDRFAAERLSPVVGRFTVRASLPGEADMLRREAFVGLVLPVRRILLDSLTRGAPAADLLALSSDEAPVNVPIHGLDAVAALFDSGKESDAMYWLARGAGQEILCFPAHHGAYEADQPEV